MLPTMLACLELRDHFHHLLAVRRHVPEGAEAVAVAIASNLDDGGGIDLGPAFGKSINQSHIAHQIDQPRDAAAEKINRRAGLVVEQIGSSANNAQAMADVIGCFHAAERLYMAVNGNTLNELAKVFSLQGVDQLGLADQNDLEQLIFFIVDVGQHTQIFEGFRL